MHVTSPQGRFAEPAKVLDGNTLRAVDACGKHLFYHFSDRKILHIHLGLYGKFRVYDNPPPDPRGAVRVRMMDKKNTIDLNGPTACEVIDALEADEILARLGPDPLRDDAAPAEAWTRIHESRTPIGMLLMDQSVIAGIGNIYRCELLWLLKINPLTPGHALSRPQFTALWRLTKQLMEIAVKHGWIVTVDLKRLKKPIAKLSRSERFNVYKQTKCPRCGSPVTRSLMGGRQVFTCKHCQPLAKTR